MHRELFVNVGKPAMVQRVCLRVLMHQNALQSGVQALAEIAGLQVVRATDFEDRTLAEGQAVALMIWPWLLYRLSPSSCKRSMLHR